MSDYITVLYRMNCESMNCKPLSPTEAPWIPVASGINRFAIHLLTNHIEAPP